MNLAPFSRRPLGCLKTSLRRARQQRVLFRRTLATAAGPSKQSAPSALPDHNFCKSLPIPSPLLSIQICNVLQHANDIFEFIDTITDNKTKKLRTAFAVYNNATTSPAQPSTPLLTPAHNDPLPALKNLQIARMDPTGARTALFSRSNRDCAKVGDVLMVTHRRGGEPFAGVLMSIRRAGIDTSILLRSQLTKVGVEMWFKVYNKNVAGIAIVRRRPKRARRARLTYLRKPKHDMGSVDHYVAAWRRSRNVMSTRSGAAAKAAKAKAKAAKK